MNQLKSNSKKNAVYVPFHRMEQPHLGVHIETDVKRLNHKFEMKRKLRIFQNFKFSNFGLGMEYFLEMLKKVHLTNTSYQKTQHLNT